MKNGNSSDMTQEYVISEEELYDLLQEVEEEMRRSEEELLEDVVEQERCQQEEIDQQIAEYEEWEDSVALHDLKNEEDCVLCPICCESMLQRSSPQGTVSCPNDACKLRLGSCSRDLPLAELKERLRLAFEGHSVQCSGTLTFEMLPTNSESGECMQQESHQLVGSCHRCDTISSII